MWRYYTKYKYMFMFSLKNLARKGLISDLAAWIFGSKTSYHFVNTGLGVKNFCDFSPCSECSVVCHPTCAPSLPPTCGMPTEYALHFASILDQAKSISTSRLSTASLQLHMKGWLKVPRYGKIQTSFVITSVILSKIVTLFVLNLFCEI